MKREHRIVYKAGITRTPSDFLCGEGELAECINLTTDHEELKVMVEPETFVNGAKVQNGSNATDTTVPVLLYVHHHNGEKRYIGYVSERETDTGVVVEVKKVYWYEKDGLNLWFKGDLGFNWNGNEQVTSIGKTLIVSDGNGMRFWLWDGTTYKYLGEDIPRPRVKFCLSGFYDNWVEEEISCSGTIVYSNNRWNVVLNQQNSWNNAVVGLYEKLKKQLHQKKCFYGSFCVRVALQLTNGTYYHISDPIMMINQFKSYCVGDIRDEQLCLVTMKLWGQELRYQMLEDFSDWSDLVKEVTLFVSAEEHLHDTSADATIVAGRVHKPICSYISNNEFWNHSEHVDETTQSGERHILLNSIDDDEVGKNLAENGVFYKLCGLGRKSMEDWSSTKSLFTVHTLENIVTQPQLPNDDYHSHCRLVPGCIYAYNSRLNLANVSRGFFGGFDTFLPYDDNTEYDYSAYVYIKTSSGERIVRNDYSTKEKQGLYFYYPDPRAYKAVICLNNQVVCELELTEHPSLNGAYYFSGMPTGEEGAPVAGDAFYATVDDSPESLVNQIVTSEVNNPFVYNASGYNTVGDGKILAMATQTAALSQGQHGQFPLIVFTDHGLWCMSVDRTGLYDTTKPMPREVCINANAILETDGAVFFVSQKGLMVIVGNDVRCVSEHINGKAFYTGSISELASIGNSWRDIITACADEGSFLAYIRHSSCFMAYDYADARILVMRPDKSYHYAYSIKDGTISKENRATVWKRAVKSYPDYLLQDSTGNIFSLYGKKREEEVTSRRKGFLLTRPMKLSGAVSVKSVRELVSVGYWNKAPRTGEQSGSVVKSKVFMSDDLQTWYEAGSRFGAAARYFRVALYVEMFPTERLSGTIIWDQERRDDNARVAPAPQ